MGNDSKNTSKEPDTNIFDVMIAIINGFFNLFKIPKIICILILYLVYRDYKVFLTHTSNSNISSYIIDVKIIERIFENDNTTIIVLGVVIAALLLIIGMLVFLVIPIYKKEIQRLTNIRSQLLHTADIDGNTMLKKHSSSKKVQK